MVHPPTYIHTHTPCSAHPREAHPFPYPLPSRIFADKSTWCICEARQAVEALWARKHQGDPHARLWMQAHVLVVGSVSLPIKGLLSARLWAHLAGAPVPSPEKPRGSWPGPPLHLLLFRNHENDACLSEKMHNV